MCSKVADKGSGDICGGADFVEIWNPSDKWVDLGQLNLTLCDNKGPEDASAFHFRKGSVIGPAGFLLGCKGDNGGDFSFEFGIGDDDTISLGVMDVEWVVVGTFTLTDGGSAGWVWQLDADEKWVYKPLGALGSMVILSKVADKGSGDICGGADFVEIWNPSDGWVDIWNVTLSDDKGPEVRALLQLR